MTTVLFRGSESARLRPVKCWPLMEAPLINERFSWLRTDQIHPSEAQVKCGQHLHVHFASRNHRFLQQGLLTSHKGPLQVLEKQLSPNKDNAYLNIYNANVLFDVRPWTQRGWRTTCSNVGRHWQDENKLLTKWARAVIKQLPLVTVVFSHCCIYYCFTRNSHSTTQSIHCLLQKQQPAKLYLSQSNNP